MATRINDACRCPRCTIRGLMGPAVVITVGILFLLDQMRGGAFDFWNTAPFILIVIGAVLLASSVAPMTGHIDSANARPRPSATPGSASGAPPTSVTGQGQ